jgi:hypothetical protein
MVHVLPVLVKLRLPLFFQFQGQMIATPSSLRAPIHLLHQQVFVKLKYSL